MKYFGDEYLRCEDLAGNHSKFIHDFILTRFNPDNMTFKAITYLAGNPVVYAAQRICSAYANKSLFEARDDPKELAIVQEKLKSAGFDLGNNIPSKPSNDIDNLYK